MNRAIKNKLRGKQRADAVDVPQTGYPYVLSTYNDRANYRAGQYNIAVVKPLQPDGIVTSWIGSTPPNR